MPRAEDERAPGACALRLGALPVPGWGARGRRLCAPASSPAPAASWGARGLGSHVSRARRRAEVWGEVGCPALPLHQAGEGGGRPLFVPGVWLRIDLAAGALGPASPCAPTPAALPTPCWLRPLGHALAAAVLEETLAGSWADRQVASSIPGF